MKFFMHVCVLYVLKYFYKKPTHQWFPNGSWYQVDHASGGHYYHWTTEALLVAGSPRVTKYYFLHYYNYEVLPVCVVRGEVPDIT